MDPTSPAVVPVLVSYLECLCLGATLLRCLVVVLIQYLGDIWHALCFGTLFILAELRSFSLLAIIPRSINFTSFFNKINATHWSSVNA